MLVVGSGHIKDCLKILQFLPTTSDKLYKLNRQLSYFGTETRVEFNGSCLKQDKNAYDHEKAVKFTLVMRYVKKLTLAIIERWEIVYLLQLVWLKMLTLISINVLDMVLDLIGINFFMLQWRNW